MHTSVFFKNIKEEIITNLKKATISVKVAVAWLTDEDIIRVLTQKLDEGLDIKIVMSNSKENFINISKFKSFLLNGGELYIAHSPFMHNKFCLIDDTLIINGSYNWSYTAIKSEENILVLKLDDNSNEDATLLKKFNVKYDYLFSKCSFKISNMNELHKFKADQHSFIDFVLKLDEDEIQLRREFEDDVKASIDKSKEKKIKIDYLYLFDRIKNDGGGVNFVKRLLHDEISSGDMKSGFIKLENAFPPLIELSLEYLVSRPKYQNLFDDDEVKFCVELMKKYNL